jgi:hypothetical protein
MVSLVQALSILSLHFSEPQVLPLQTTWAVADSQVTVKVVLYNPRLTAIPLVIPGIMNPNLLPLSRSYIELAVGQEIFVVRNGRRVLLYTVPANLTQGTELNCGELLDQLKRK